MSGSHGLAGVVRLLRTRYGDGAADGELLGRFAHDRDGAAFAELVHRYGRLVLGVAFRRLGDRHAAEDVAQSTFLALAHKAGRLGRTGSLVNWLYTVALRQADKVRAATGRRAALQRELRPRVASADPLSEVSGRELVAVIDDELARLPEAYRLPLLLCAVEGLSRDEAARRLGWPIGAVKGRLERGRELLRRRLEARGLTVPTVLTGVLAADAASALPPGLAAATVQAALAAAPVTWWSVKALALAAAVVVATGTGVGLAWRGSKPAAADTLGAPPSVAHATVSPAEPQLETPRVDRYGDPLPPGAVLRLGTLRWRTQDSITHLSVRPGGRYVTFCNGNAVATMDLNTGEVLRKGGIHGNKSDPMGGFVEPLVHTALTFAPDARTFAVGTTARRDGGWPAPFWLCDATTGQRLREFASIHQQVRAMAFLAGSRQIASFGDEGVICVWDTTTAVKLHEIQGPGRKLTSFAASPDGRTLAAGAEARDGTAAIYLWDADGKPLRTLTGHAADVSAVAFAPDGRTLATGGNATVRLWDVATGRELRQLTGHAREDYDKLPCAIRSLAFSPDGRSVASASTDRTARTWSVATGQALDEVPCVSADVATFLDDRTLLVAFYGIGTIKGQPILLLRDVTTHAIKNRDVGAWYKVRTVGYAPDGRTIATTDILGFSHQWDATTGRNLSTKPWNPLSAYLVISPDGRLVAFTEKDGNDDFVCVGDVATGAVVRRLSEPNQLGQAFSPDGQRLLTAFYATSRRPRPRDKPELTVWDTSTGAKLGQFPALIWNDCAAFASDGRSVFLGEGRLDPPYRLRQWDVASGQPVKEFALPEPTQGAHLPAVSPGGRRLAAVVDGKIHLWDVVTGQECWQAWAKEASSAAKTTFSPDGTLLAVAGMELRDARTGELMAGELGIGTGTGTMGTAFSPDSRRLVAGWNDGTALVWDLEAVTGRKLGGPLDDARQAALWDDLAGNAALAAHAIDCWQAAPRAAVPILRRHLKPAAAVSAEHIQPLIAALDSPAFVVREQATKNLTALGPAAELPLRASLASASAEARGRIETILATWAAEQTRVGRAVEVLEAIATPDARALLEELAGGDPPARLTREAKSSLERLRRPK